MLILNYIPLHFHCTPNYSYPVLSRELIVSSLANINSKLIFNEAAVIYENLYPGQKLSESNSTFITDVWPYVTGIGRPYVVNALAVSPPRRHVRLHLIISAAAVSEITCILKYKRTYLIHPRVLLKNPEHFYYFLYNNIIVPEICTFPQGKRRKKSFHVILFENIDQIDDYEKLQV